MERPPAVLCIQLKRFSLFGGKIGKPVQLNRHLNVTNYVHPGVTKKLSSNGIHYVLRSMITHVGPSPNCGHYTAIGEAAGGQFFQFDDAYVKPIALQQVLSTASYVVFYEMVPSSWKGLIGGRAPAPSAQPKPVPAQPSPLPAAPRIINASGLVNKLGVVSTVAKGVVNSVADVAKSLNGSPKPKPKNYGVLGKVTGLVPYDKDSSSEEEAAAPTSSKGSLTSNTPKPGFVPRAVTIKNLPKPVSATNGKWTVTDIDHHNPSVHSDNSTGSTSNSWKVTPQRPQSAMSTEDASTTGKWTVTPLRKAIEEDSSELPTIPNGLNGRHHQQNGTSTPSSSSSSSGSSLDKISRKRPSVDESAGDDYDAELDRGRTKKVKKQEMTHSSASPSVNAASNPFQSYQDRQNSHRHSSSSRSNQHRNSNGNHSSNRDRGYPQQQPRSHSGYNQYHHRQRHSYSSDRRKSFGGHDHKNHYQQHHYKSYHRSYEPDHYRDFNRRRSR